MTDISKICEIIAKELKRRGNMTKEEILDLVDNKITLNQLCDIMQGMQDSGCVLPGYGGRSTIKRVEVYIWTEPTCPHMK